MYRQIVVGTDGSRRAEAAIEQAAFLALLSGAELDLIQGCGSPIVGTVLPEAAAFVNPSQVVEASGEQLETLAETLRSRGLSTYTHAVPTSGHGALCEVAAKLDADLIVVGNRGMTGAGRFLDSVPNAAAHQAPCSVLIVATN
jgi:nucleotide-binding universal stress UspA family protein